MKLARRHNLIGLLCAVSVACAPKTPDVAPKITEIRNYQANFVCEDDQRMHVKFSPFTAELDSQGMSVAMTQEPAADGFRYAGGGQSLSARGSEAAWTDGKGTVHHCREAIAGSTNSNSLAQ